MSESLERLYWQNKKIRQLVAVDTEMRVIEMDRVAGDMSIDEANAQFDTVKERQIELWNSLPAHLQYRFGVAMGYILPPKNR